MASRPNERDADELEDAGRPPGARGAPAKPRSGPAKRSSARPIAATGADARLERADDPADERQAQAAVVVGERAEGEQDVAQLAAAVERTRAGRGRSRGGGAGARSPRPRGQPRSASSVMRASQPNPAAGGKHAPCAAGGDSARWPESGSRRSRPVPRRSSSPRGPLDDPEARRPASRRRRRSRGRPRSRRAAARSPTRSASQRRRRPGGASRSASASACPLPRRGSRQDPRARPPPPRARCRRASRRRRRSPPRPGTARAARRPSRRSVPPRRGRRRGSSAGSATRDGGGDLREDAVAGGLLRGRTGRAGAAEQEGEREPARLGVDVVDGRELLLGERRRPPMARGLGHLDADGGDAVEAEPGVEAGEEAGGRAGLRLRTCGRRRRRRRAARRCRTAPRPGLAEQRFQSGLFPPATQVVAEPPAELADPPLRRERRRAPGGRRAPAGASAGRSAASAPACGGARRPPASSSVCSTRSDRRRRAGEDEPMPAKPPPSAPGRRPGRSLAPLRREVGPRRRVEPVFRSRSAR